MANVDEIRAQRGQTGASGDNKTDWQKQLEMLSMAALAKGASPATMAGFALGKFLSNMIARRNAKNDETKNAEALKILEGNIRGDGAGTTTGAIGNDNANGYSVGAKFEELYDPYYMKDHDVFTPKAKTSITLNNTGGSVVDGTTPENQRDNGYSELANYIRSKDGDYDLSVGLESLKNGGANDMAALGNRGEYGYNVGNGKLEYIPLNTGLLSNSGVKYPASNSKTIEEQVPGLIEKGNIDLYNRPIVYNDDGSISTVQSMSFQPSEGIGAGHEVLIPTISDDGRRMTDEEAQQYYYYNPNGARYLGIFDTPENSTTYAIKLHNDQDKYYNARRKQ